MSKVEPPAADVLAMMERKRLILAGARAAAALKSVAVVNGVPVRRSFSQPRPEPKGGAESSRDAGRPPEPL